ncbi:hypothetical protein [Parasedimentitalea maritima]|uniref:Uncharacterized protein n=1 Tax=Parasedimentitalea maritima TaxID=2578117 RepID=A0A6A4R953_9RHOB|nr:hypothetical protein [Zongyanglinia marina]KAE9628859.1 hypothetical protein GP644_13915 [Zongyanglinia marina]
MEIVAIGSALLLLLAALKALAPTRMSFLPLGGTTISEIGIVFAVCVALTTLMSYLQELL